MVAFTCSENKVPSPFDAAICSARNADSTRADMTVASTTAPDSSLQPSLRTEGAAPLATNSIRAGPACASVSVADFSLP